MFVFKKWEYFSFKCAVQFKVKSLYYKLIISSEYVKKLGIDPDSDARKVNFTMTVLGSKSF